MKFLIKTLKELDDVARLISKKFKAGQFVAVRGKMGSGKTTLIKSIGKHLGVKKPISSPSYVFLKTHKAGRAKIKYLHHFDAWRLENPYKADNILNEEGLDEKQALLLVEWPEKIRFKRVPDLIIKISKARLSDNRIIEVLK